MARFAKRQAAVARRRFRGIGGRLALAAVLALFAAVVAASGGGHALGVTAVVVPQAALAVDTQAKTLSIGAADIARGYVDVARGSRVRVTTSSRAGYVVEFHPRLPIFRSVQVESGGRIAEIGADGGAMVARGQGRGSAAEFTYRFALAPGLSPGEYAWPLAVSVRALPDTHQVTVTTTGSE